MENWDNIQTDYSNLNTTGSNNNGGFTEVPDGQYMCTVEELELTRSKKGFPMIKGRFRIKEGEFGGKLMFVNKVLLRSYDGSTNDNFLVHNCNAFLESFHVVSDVKLTTLSAYAATVEYISQTVTSGNSYYVVNKTTKKGFSDYTIAEGPLTYEPTNTYPEYQTPAQPVAVPEIGAPLPPQDDDVPF